MTTRVVDILPPGGNHASRPAATAVPAGGLYSCTTHSLIYRSDGTTWSTWATLANSAVPIGGTTGQVLAKNSGTDYDTGWATPSGGGGSGASLQLANVRCVATGNVNLASGLVNGASGTLFDDVTLATGDRVLCPLQTTGSASGIYIVAASGAAVRAADADATGELVTGSYVYVNEGTGHAGTYSVLTTTGTITIGTTSQTWSKIGIKLTGTSTLGYGVSLGPRTGSGGSNTAIGDKALFYLGTGTNNIGIGAGAGANSAFRQDNGSNNVIIGNNSGVGNFGGNTFSDDVVLGHQATCGHSNCVVLGSGSNSKQNFQVIVGPRAIAMQKIASAPTSSGDSTYGEFFIVDDGSGNLILKVVLDSKVISLAHELGATFLVPFATGSRPSASAMGAGAVYYDTTLSKPGFSDGTNWKDAAGTTI